ncbi:MAG: hypothetical protein R6U19_00635 [Bacteroidales bacterium]
MLCALMPFATSCDKQDDMVGRVKVVFADEPEVRVKDARVELQKNDIKIVGYTNDNGIFEFTFRLKMKLNVSAYKDTSTVTNTPTLNGTGSIAMGEYGVDSEETIFLSN